MCKRIAGAANSSQSPQPPLSAPRGAHLVASIPRVRVISELWVPFRHPITVSPGLEMVVHSKQRNLPLVRARRGARPRDRASRSGWCIATRAPHRDENRLLPSLWFFRTHVLFAYWRRVPSAANRHGQHGGRAQIAFSCLSERSEAARACPTVNCGVGEIPASRREQAHGGYDRDQCGLGQAK
jgi:hypothetical protein